MERPQDLGVGRSRVGGEVVQRESHGPYRRLELASLHLFESGVIAVAGDRLELDDVARLKEDHKVPEIGRLLLRIVDRHGRDAKHLVAAGAAYRVDAAEASAMADRQIRSVRTRGQVLG